MPVLVLLASEHSQRAVEVLPLDRPSTIIGRAAGVDVPLMDPSVSRKHAEILKGPGGWVVTTLNAANPVRVDGQPVQSVTLRPGLVLEVGVLRLRFEPTDPRAADTLVGGDRNKPRSGSPQAVPSPVARRSATPWVFGVLGLVVGGLVLAFRGQLAVAIWIRFPDLALWLDGLRLSLD